MEFKILNEEKIPMAEFMNYSDRDDFFDFLEDRYPDCKWYKAKGDDLEEGC